MTQPVVKPLARCTRLFRFYFTNQLMIIRAFQKLTVLSWNCYRFCRSSAYQCHMQLEFTFCDVSCRGRNVQIEYGTAVLSKACHKQVNGNGPLSTMRFPF
ncbi:hypothetical protein Tsp_03789 [Trichinella spiralis]|uniref:hypothetical protein n=1 Tax=Trichinella spiralis TaxID=6334 RepID=UPI0001EFBEF5|nr:hypothetical protein Tsp_03789 [Trichinella spiralis]